MKVERKNSITRGMIWMLIISTLLFWLPVAGPLLAGIIGGKKAGGVGSAILAALLLLFYLGSFCFWYLRY
ncbi:MAG: hypothetical protein ACOCZY_02230 [Bacillota bacterium]